MGLVKLKATQAAGKLPDDSAVSSRSSFNCEREGCSIELVVNSRQCPSLS